MTVLFASSFEAQAASIDLLASTTAVGSIAGTAAYSTTQHRTGAAAMRCNPISGASGTINLPIPGTPIALHFGLFIASLPSVTRSIGGTGVGTANTTLDLHSDGKLEYKPAGVAQGSGAVSSLALSINTWYWIGVRLSSGSSVAAVQVDGSTWITTTTDAASGTWGLLGPGGVEASAIDLYFDDIVTDNAAFLSPSKVAMLVPTADSAVGTGWTNDAAGTSSLFNAVDNEPPVGIADTSASTGLHQIRNATSNANVNYDATMTTYTAAGVATGDSVLSVLPLTATAAPVTTSSKQGTVGVASNPAITNIALAAGGTAGAFWSGVAGGTFPTGWKISPGTITASPSVTNGTAPVMRVTQVTASTRIAVVCFMGILVVWTPAAVVASVPYSSPYPQLLPQ